jgi:uncharacterized membrane protein
MLAGKMEKMVAGGLGLIWLIGAIMTLIMIMIILAIISIVGAGCERNEMLKEVKQNRETSSYTMLKTENKKLIMKPVNKKPYVKHSWRK